MIKHIQQTFACYQRQNINRTWLTFMSCLNMIIKHLGDNNYKIPKMNKAKMEQEGSLCMVLHVSDAAEPLMEMREMTDSMDKVEMDDVDDS